MDETLFDRVTLVILRRGARALEYGEAELDQLQTGHLTFLEEMHKEGHLLAAGPFTDQGDETFRGVCMYRTSIEETLELTKRDPMVKAERLAIQAMTWWTKRGTLRFGS